MSETLLFLTAPFVMCLILVGIHCYLGLHVLARGVIFVDLALAQVAAFGAAVALLFGYDHHGLPTYLISLSATLVAAYFLASANRLRLYISQEALIGILYALASASIILLIDKMSHGSEHLKQTLVGQLIWVTWEDVLKTSAVYAFVGAVHYYFRKQLIESSFQEKSKWKWDFLFYGLFGVVITSSVHIAGVLLVFAFLIVPAVVSSIFYQDLRSRLIFGWILGALLSFIGLFVSYFWDLPAGAATVVVFTALPVLLVGVFWRVRSLIKK